jgi:hypothetical protein
MLGWGRLERIDAVEEICTRAATRRMFVNVDAEGFRAIFEKHARKGQWGVCDSTLDPCCYPAMAGRWASTNSARRGLSLENRKRSIQSWRPMAAASSRTMAMESMPRGSLRKGLFAVLVPARARRHVAGVIVGPSVLRPGLGIRIV